MGDRVFMRVLAGKVGLARKLQKRFSGPWVVTKVNECNAWIRRISCPFDVPKVVHLNMLKKYTGPSIPPQVENDFSETGSEEEAAGVNKSDVDNVGSDQRDDQAEGNSSKEGNTGTEIPEEMPQTLEDEQPDGSTDESQISATEPKRSMGHYNLRRNPMKK